MEVLDHFPEVKFMLSFPPGSAVAPLSLGGFLKQLTVLHLSAEQDPWSVGTVEALDEKCKGINAYLQQEADPPVEVAAKVLYHEAYVLKMKNARDHELDNDEGTGVSKLEGVKTQAFRSSSPVLEALCAVRNVNSNAVFQQAFNHRCKLLIMYLLEICTAVPDFHIFTALSPHRGEFDAYIGWCMSVEEDGSLPEAGRDKKLGAKHLKGIKGGKWVEELDL
jgi:hypothetical protein